MNKMNINGLSCEINMPEALSGEEEHSLPPYCKKETYLVDEYDLCPSDWMRSNSKIKSYFVQAKENKGMWLDFNDNWSNTHDVAIVISIQGINPITGLKCSDNKMEQYIDKCPKHNIEFGPDRFCKECNYQWAKQNYLSTTGTPNRYLWLDGFRNVDGIVRQYILTSEKMRGVANNIIGKERVFAIGVSFYLSKEKKTIPEYTTYIRNSGPNYIPYWDTMDTEPLYTKTYPEITCKNHEIKYLSNFSENSNVMGSSVSLDFIGTDKSATRCFSINKNDAQQYIRRSKKSEVKKLEVAAGAKIRQKIYDDPRDLSFWNEECAGTICINYCVDSEFSKIINGKKNDIIGNKEGFLQNMSVGN